MGRFEMMICPLCARSRPVYSKRWRNPEIRWDFWDENSPFVQIREGGGKKPGKGLGSGKRGSAPGAGFPTVQAFTLDGANKQEQYQKAIKEMIQQIRKIFEIVKKYD